MNVTDIPARFPIPFANGADSSHIRTIPLAHVPATSTDAPASLTDGFPPETFLPLSSGGIPPNGMDFNGILNQLSAWARWTAAGGPAVFNSTFSSAIGGYPKGAQVASTAGGGKIWVSTVDGNTTDPDGGSAANWVALQPAAAAQAPITITINGNGWAFGIKIGSTTYLIQFCKVFISTSGSASFSWPTPFPSSLFVAVPGGMQGLTYSGSYSAYLTSLTNTGGIAYGNNGGGATSTVGIIAVGS